ncbi:hypothetical protein M8C13_22315 [Crossiella sp. SN42]|uniref:hypothetical protein n=1 Tax=unclassified Crossiella TaxID=2620835 RepID=UPI00207CEF6F|nr:MULTISPECIES: hypothetical protein [unclassified Crossiella]MCO1578491.1 hypothetical protein [Crossiella sp. SN42]WHT22310.1 hypothetical protein N8J89_14955 [Crossiella sp. CA-258035]
MSPRYWDLKRQIEDYRHVARQLPLHQPDNDTDLHYFRQFGGPLAAPSPFDSLFLNRTVQALTRPLALRDLAHGSPG